MQDAVAKSNQDGLFSGVPYDYGAVAPAGATLFTAGACPLDSSGHVVGLGDLAEQARVSIENLVLALARYGATPENLVKTTIFVVGDQEDLVRAWNVIAKRLAPLRPPSTLVGVTALGYAGQLVEIEGIATIGNEERSG
jgi:enamine deaminase RidA (YjgF/YER057c/UK114 family)